MEGERSDDTSISWEDDPLSGLIPRAMQQVFEQLQKQVGLITFIIYVCNTLSDLQEFCVILAY